MGKKNKTKKEAATVMKPVEPKVKGKKKLGEKNLDEFLDTWDDDSSDEEEENIKTSVVNDGDLKNENEDDENSDEESYEEDSDEDDDESEDEEVKNKEKNNVKEGKGKIKTGAKDQKNYISKLKEKDPEFFEFLQENDEELLNFDESSDDEEMTEKEKQEQKHKPPEKLEVASDESDFEDDEENKSEPSGDKKKLNQAQVDAWVTALASQPSVKLVTEVMDAFKGAVAAVGAGNKDGDEKAIVSKYRVEGGTMFNSVVRMAVVNLVPSLKKVLRLDQEAEGGQVRPEKSKHWRKLERPLRNYMADLVTLLTRVSESSVLCVLLKHAHSMLPFYQAFAKGAKQLMNRLIIIWSSGDETPRILSFMCIVKLVRGRDLLEPCVKAMYLAYVKNCKFTSPSTQQSIGFMKRSLVELLGLDHSLAYYQAFVYIRQLAIHLRNAITCSEKKDSLLAVYNWQFIHSLELWGALVGHPGSREAMQPLIYPLVQVVIGTCKLVPTPKYFPLRFHCAKILRDISTSTGTFIPVLPIYLEVINTYNFGKKNKKASMKPFDFSCILKLSKSQLLESGMKDATMEEVYSGLLSYLADNSNRIGFPELVTPMLFQLKDFLKKCKQANYSKKVKQIVDKTAANQKFIETRRRNVSFGVGDRPAIQAWEAQVANDGTPLLAFYKNWKKVSDIQHAKKVSNQSKLDDYSHIPALKKNHKKIRMKSEQEAELEGGFLSGSDDDFDDEENFKLKEDRGKKRKNEEDSEEDDSEDEIPQKMSKVDAAEEDSNDEEEEGDEVEGEDDKVEDLNLEDLDSDLEMDDDFGAAEIVEEDNSDEDSDDDSDDSE